MQSQACSLVGVFSGTVFLSRLLRAPPLRYPFINWCRGVRLTISLSGQRKLVSRISWSDGKIERRWKAGGLCLQFIFFHGPSSIFEGNGLLSCSA